MNRTQALEYAKDLAADCEFQLEHIDNCINEAHMMARALIAAEKDLEMAVEALESRIRQIMAHIDFVREGILFKPTPINKIHASKLEDARVALRKIADELAAEALKHCTSPAPLQKK